MMRFLSFGGSAALHAGALGAVLAAGYWGLRQEPARASVDASASVPLSLDVNLDTPRTVAFEAPSLPDSLPVAEAALEYEAERVVEETEAASLLAPAPGRPSPQLERPLRTCARIPTSPAPAPEVEAEIAPLDIHNPPPAYPAAARRRGLEGSVLVELRIRTDGTVADAAVLECAGSPAFADAALEAVASWRYLPATLGGAPVERAHRVRFRFKLAD